VLAKKLFGQRLVYLRVKRRISQEELAWRVDVSVMTIRRWEHGEYGPEFDRLEKIAQALGVEIRDLFDFREKPDIE
jgi:transcriptional regulator with XRE-family HTH domain